MEARLGQRLRLGLESLPRLARPGRPEWPSGMGALGAATAVGASAATSAIVGARGSADVEPDRQGVGILEQRDLDSDLKPAAVIGEVVPRAPRAADWVGCSLQYGETSSSTRFPTDRHAAIGTTRPYRCSQPDQRSRQPTGAQSWNSLSRKWIRDRADDHAVGQPGAVIRRILTETPSTCSLRSRETPAPCSTVGAARAR